MDGIAVGYVVTGILGPAATTNRGSTSGWAIVAGGAGIGAVVGADGVKGKPMRPWFVSQGLFVGQLCFKVSDACIKQGS